MRHQLLLLLLLLRILVHSPMDSCCSSILLLLSVFESEALLSELFTVLPSASSTSHSDMLLYAVLGLLGRQPLP
jgi:hypothetical protein